MFAYYNNNNERKQQKKFKLSADLAVQSDEGTQIGPQGGSETGRRFIDYFRTAGSQVAWRLLGGRGIRREDRGVAAGKYVRHALHSHQIAIELN